MRRRYQNLRNWRIRRWQAYLARHATSRDPAAEHYYDKAYNYYYEQTGRVHSDLSSLLGKRRATNILLSESVRTRLPGRLLRYTWWWFILTASPWSSIGRAITSLCLLVVAIGVNSSNGARAAKRNFAAEYVRLDGDMTSVLKTLTPWGRRAVLRRTLEFPARTLTTGNRSLLLPGLPHLTEGEMETIEKLAEEYDGTLRELLETARLLDD